MSIFYLFFCSYCGNGSCLSHTSFFFRPMQWIGCKSHTLHKEGLNIYSNERVLLNYMMSWKNWRKIRANFSTSMLCLRCTLILGVNIKNLIHSWSMQWIWNPIRWLFLRISSFLLTCLLLNYLIPRLIPISKTLTGIGYGKRYGWNFYQRIRRHEKIKPWLFIKCIWQMDHEKN